MYIGGADLHHRYTDIPPGIYRATALNRMRHTVVISHTRFISYDRIDDDQHIRDVETQLKGDATNMVNFDQLIDILLI